MQIVVEHPVGQSFSGFAQARSIVIAPQAAPRQAEVPPDVLVVSNVGMLRTAHRMMEAFETASRAAHSALVDEAGALITETFELTVGAFQARTISDWLDLQGNYARKRCLAAANLTSAMLMPAGTPHHTHA